MRILFLDQFSQMGGAQQCLRDVLGEVRARGWQAQVMAPGDGPLLDFARKIGCDARSLPLGEYSSGRKTIRDFLRYGSAIRKCARIIRDAIDERPPDLIYVNGPRVLPAVAFAHPPLVFHAHSVPMQSYVSVLTNWTLGRRHAQIIACSEFVARSLRPSCDSVRVVYNGVSDHGFRPRPGEGGALRVGMLGRIAPEKGHGDFIRTAARLKDRPDVTFRVVGSALFSNASFEKSVRTAGESVGVEFVGWTDEVANALHDLDVLAVPSAANDASPRVILDAFAAGTCVVAYPSGGIPELLRHDDNGLLTTRGSPVELAGLIRLLAGDPQRRKRLAANGRRDWESHYQVDRFAAEVCDLLARAVTSPERDASGVHSGSEAQASAHGETAAAPGNRR